MTLFTTDYLEYYLTLVGWIVHNGIWAVLVSSGVFALPFVAIIIQEWLKARAEGADEGNKGVLSSMRIENRVWVAIVVVMFAGIPFIDVDMSMIRFDTSRSAQCQVNVPQPSDTGWSQSFTTLNNQSAKVPVWWAFMHTVSRAVTGASIAAIPCGTDLRQMRIEVDATRIDDPVLAQEVADFTHDCYGPARAKLFMNRPALDEAQMHDVTWIGSRFFLDSAGYYDTYRANTPRDGWPYDSNRDAGLAQVPSGAGYPTCRQWWSDGGTGLRARLPTPAPLAVANAAPGAPQVAAAAPAPDPAPVSAPAAAPTAAPAAPAPPAPPRIELPSSNATHLNNPSPGYPAISKRLGEQGRVMLRVLIGADGLPQKVEVSQSSGYERLDRQAQEAVMRWRFVPGKRSGVPEAMWYAQPINFVLE